MNKVETGSKFAEKLTEYIQSNNRKNRNKPIDVCDTPNALLAVGAKQLPVVMNINDIDKCIDSKTANKNKNNHDLTFAELSSLPELLSNPVIILKKPDDKKPDANIITVITDKIDKDGKPFLIGVELNEKDHNHMIHRVSTMHVREKDLFDSFIAKNGNEVLGYVPRNIVDGNLLAINIEKAPNFLRSTGLQLPEGEKSIVTYDNSITHSMGSVKPLDEFNKKLIFGTTPETTSEKNPKLNAELNGKITENDITDTLENIKEVMKETPNRNGGDR